MSKWFWVILGLGVAVLIGVFALAGGNQETAKNNTQQRSTEVTDQDHTLGPATAKVTLLEYGDFQCPACGNFYSLAKEAKKSYGNRLRFVFRHFPISSIHPHAFAAARAAEAAGNQNKFFAMHDLLYERQKDWSSQSNVKQIFEGYAQELGLDMQRYKDDVSSNATTDLINAQLGLGKDQGVDATPGLFLNDQKIENPRNFNELKSKIDALLKS